MMKQLNLRTLVIAAACFFLLSLGSAVAATSTNYESAARKISKGVQNAVPYSHYGCVNWDATSGAKRPIRVVLNNRRSLAKARNIVARNGETALTKFVVLKQSYSEASQLRNAKSIASSWAPSGAEATYSVSVVVEEDANDSPACGAIVIQLINYAGHPITDTTRQWAQLEVGRFPSGLVKVVESTTTHSEPVRPL